MEIIWLNKKQPTMIKDELKSFNAYTNNIDNTYLQIHDKINQSKKYEISGKEHFTYL